jgi:3-oxoacyl-[acyl-carrier protein] reductase
MELGLTGKRALVTAASKGLGRAIAEALLAEGCRLCICSSNEERIQAAAAEMAASPGGEVHAMSADLGDSAQCDALFDWTVTTLGGLDILVNNTGGPPASAVLDTDDAQWRRSFDSILMSALRLSRAAIPVMRQGGHGAIVNLASLSAKQPIDGIALSNTFRPALVGMAKTLAREAAPEVRINTIATEHILTGRIHEIAGRVWARDGESVDATLQRMALEVPMRRYGTPQEFANAVVFLASDAASYITGVTLAVDGGMDRGLF